MSPVTGFGVHLSLHPPEEQFALVRRVEELGFDSVWTGDHVSFHNPLYESLTLLAAYAPITRRLKLGVAVYLLALRSAAVAAKVTSTLDVLSGGRLIFGVGVGGENPKEFELCGVLHAERGARVTEGIDVVRALWRDTPATFQGRFNRFAGISIDPKPVQVLPPIWVGGRSDAALTRAGRQGDGWVSYVIQPERYARSLEKIPAAAHPAGGSHPRSWRSTFGWRSRPRSSSPRASGCRSRSARRPSAPTRSPRRRSSPRGSRSAPTWLPAESARSGSGASSPATPSASRGRSAASFSPAPIRGVRSSSPRRSVSCRSARS